MAGTLVPLSSAGTFPARVVEAIQDIAAAMLTAGTGISVAYDDTQGKVTISATGSSGGSGLDVEAVQDVVGGMLQAGSGATVSYDDPAGKVTISATGGGSGVTDTEVVRDAIAAALRTSGLITVTADDAGDAITIGTAATANSTDAQLRDRSTHTGSQTSSTISDFTEAAQDIAAAMLTAGTGISVSYDDPAGKVTISATGGSGGGGGVTDTEVVRDAIAAALRTSGLITVTADDAGDTITIGTTATANSTDAQLRDRSTHTGSQTSSTISDFTEAAQDAVAAMLAAGSNVALSYNDAANTLTVSSSASGGGGGTGTDPEVVRDTIGIALVGIAGAVVTVNDAADTITLSVGNITQAQVTGLTAALAAKADRLETVSVVQASGAAVTLVDPTVATVHDVALTANCTVKIPAAATGLVASTITVLLHQDGTGTRTVTWATTGADTIVWLGGTAATALTGANALTAVSFFSVAGQWYGSPTTAPSSGGGTGAVSSVAGRTGDVVLAKNDVGLGNLTNVAQVAKAGDTMTGPLVLSGDPTNVLHAATMQWVLARIADLTAGSPAQLDTFLEVFNRFVTDENALTALTGTVANKQPLDDDLTAIAGLATLAFGRSLLTGADAPSVRALLALGNAATENMLDANGRILSQYLRQTTQQQIAWRRPDTVADTDNRYTNLSTVALTSQTPYGRGIRLVKGQQVSGLRYFTSAASASTNITHFWAALCDSTGAVVAKTNDDTNQWGGGTNSKKLVFESPFTPTADGNFYAVLVIGTSSGTTPVLAAVTNAASLAGNFETPAVSWVAASNSGLVGPTTCPNQFVPSAGFSGLYVEGWN